MAKTSKKIYWKEKILSFFDTDFFFRMEKNDNDELTVVFYDLAECLRKNQLESEREKEGFSEGITS